jgi:3'(2'), 5'-bisphosphate nucleotidase
MNKALYNPLDDYRTVFVVDTLCKAASLSKIAQEDLMIKALSKADQSPVTVADFAVQALIGKLIDDAFPGEVLVGEENAETLKTESGSETLGQVVSLLGKEFTDTTNGKVCEWIDRGSGQPTSQFWTLDPVDGTKGFLRRDQFAIALAWIVSGVVELGGIACPSLDLGGEGGPGAIFVARRGRGSWVCKADKISEIRPIRVSSILDPAMARVLRSVESAHTNEDQFEKVIQQLKIVAPPVCMDSQAKYGMLAIGKAELLLRLLPSSSLGYREKIWDQAAGAIVLEEAGGRITDLFGEKLDFSQGITLDRNQGVVASNSYMHEAVLEILKEQGFKN